MPQFRDALPQLSDRLFMTDGGLETTLVFLDKIDLPCFAACHLLSQPGGVDHLNKYFAAYVDIAHRYNVGMILESVTWRANPDWAEKLGYTSAQLIDVNRQAIDMLTRLRDAAQTESSPMVISGCIGPRGDGYDPGSAMTPDEAERYHQLQADTFADSDADLVTAITMTNTPEAIGVARAAQKAGMPVVISFTVETDAALPTGQPLAEAIQAVDAATDAGPAYYMINCAHPTHFRGAIERDEPWVRRVRALRANASALSHEELDNATELDSGDPADLARHHRELVGRLPHLSVLGGCCGTDHRHVEQIIRACASAT